jgi:glucose/arabinose dehydrogenase
MIRKHLAPGLSAVVGLASVSALGQLTDPIPAPIAKSSIAIELQAVATNLVAPNLLTHAGDGTDRQFIVDQPGQVRLIKGGALQATPYLDASSLLVSPLGGIIPPFQDPFGDFDERGLLGLAFHPDFDDIARPGYGKFYTYTSEPVTAPADFTVPLPIGEVFNHQSVVREWNVDPGADVIAGDPAFISRELMRIDEPQFNHNAGMVAFGPDGNLYISIGDGGFADDNAPGHGPTGNGQNPANILGTVVRIDPLGSDSANGRYGIPASNPFVTDATRLDEIYAFGFRNPFRFSFDVDPATGAVTPGTTGQLIVADVGQNQIEEIDIVTPGGNFGWNQKEGSFRFDAGAVFGDLVGVPPGLIDPVLEYDHDEGISVIGGFVYRGSAIPELVGKYVFGDFSNAGFFTPGGRLFVGDLTTGLIEELTLGLDDRALGLFVKGFGQDADGELYVLAGTNLGPFRDSTGQGFGQVLRIVPVPEPATAALLGLACLGWVRRRP